MAEPVHPRWLESHYWSVDPLRIVKSESPPPPWSAKAPPPRQKLNHRTLFDLSLRLFPARCNASIKLNINKDQFSFYNPPGGSGTNGNPSEFVVGAYHHGELHFPTPGESRHLSLKYDILAHSGQLLEIV